jgi:hypothetical protein
MKDARDEEHPGCVRVGDRAPATLTNYFLNVTLQEQYERLERLGLPVPVIESDNEEDYASDDADDSR